VARSLLGEVAAGAALVARASRTSSANVRIFGSVDFVSLIY
jgi:hypothetical protein